MYITSLILLGKRVVHFNRCTNMIKMILFLLPSITLSDFLFNAIIFGDVFYVL